MDLPGPFRIIGESAAGEGFSGSPGTAEAVRIFTGAAVPEGADTVIMQENCAREGDTLRLTAEPPAPGRDIRVRGSDRSEEHTSELQSLMRISYADLCLKT